MLDVLATTGNAIDATITYVDDATGNTVSKHWNEIPEHTRNQIKGGATVASIFIPGGSIKVFKQLKTARKLTDGLRGAIDFDLQQLQKKYQKHVEDFGVTGNYNTANRRKIYRYT